jgi:hypothetical protein
MILQNELEIMHFIAYGLKGLALKPTRVTRSPTKWLSKDYSFILGYGKASLYVTFQSVTQVDAAMLSKWCDTLRRMELYYENQKVL